MALVMFTYSAGIFAFVRHVLDRDLNARLRDDLEFVKESFQLTDQGIDLARPGQSREHDEHQPWVEVWEEPATIRFRTPRAGSAMVDELTALPREGDTFASLIAVNGERLRSLTGAVRIGTATYAVRVARSEEPMRHELGELAMGMLFASPLAIGLAGLVGAQMARRALQPIERMAERARSITAERLHDRLPVENPSDELGHLAGVFNETLSRLEQSFDRLRRFTADASHELRTPLTAIRSVGEVGLSEEHDPHGYRDIIGSMLEEAERLTKVVDALLTLSRADAAASALTPEDVELGELAREVVEELCVLAEEKGQVLKVTAPVAVMARANRLVLTQALVNLIDNAVKYSPEGALTTIAVHATAEAHIDVIDQGPGVPSEHRDRIFDRFYRIDRSRTRDAGGAGLGLSIAKWAVEANGGRLVLLASERSGTTFRITVPLSTA